MMESFRILKNSNRHLPQISLMGNFDITAVGQLLESIEDSNGFERITVRTDCITSIARGASEQLSEAFSKIGGLRSKVYFCGAYAQEIAPQGALVFL